MTRAVSNDLFLLQLCKAPSWDGPVAAGSRAGELSCVLCSGTALLCRSPRLPAPEVFEWKMRGGTVRTPVCVEDRGAAAHRRTSAEGSVFPALYWWCTGQG